MSMKKPIILGHNDQHTPLAGADKLDPSVITISNAAGNLLANDPINGLAATLATQNSQHVTLSGNGAAASPLSADVVVSDKAGNLIEKLPSGLFAAGGGLFDAAAQISGGPSSQFGSVIAPTFDTKYQSETFVLADKKIKEYTFDVSQFEDLIGSPQYHVQLVGLNIDAVVKLTGRVAIFDISGNMQSSEYSLPLYKDQVMVYDIYYTAYYQPRVVMRYPFCGEVAVAPALRVEDSVSMLGMQLPDVAKVGSEQLAALRLYGRTNLRVRCTAHAACGELQAAELKRLEVSFSAGSAGIYTDPGKSFSTALPIFVASDLGTAPLSTSPWLTMSVEEFNKASPSLTIQSNAEFKPTQPVKVETYYEIVAY